MAGLKIGVAIGVVLLGAGVATNAWMFDVPRAPSDMFSDFMNQDQGFYDMFEDAFYRPQEPNCKCQRNCGPRNVHTESGPHQQPVTSGVERLSLRDLRQRREREARARERGVMERRREEEDRQTQQREHLHRLREEEDRQTQQREHLHRLREEEDRQTQQREHLHRLREEEDRQTQQREDHLKRLREQQRRKEEELREIQKQTRLEVERLRQEEHRTREKQRQREEKERLRKERKQREQRLREEERLREEQTRRDEEAEQREVQRLREAQEQKLKETERMTEEQAHQQQIRLKEQMEIDMETARQQQHHKHHSTKRKQDKLKLKEKMILRAEERLKQLQKKIALLKTETEETKRSLENNEDDDVYDLDIETNTVTKVTPENTDQQSDVDTAGGMQGADSDSHGYLNPNFEGVYDVETPPPVSGSLAAESAQTGERRTLLNIFVPGYRREDLRVRLSDDQGTLLVQGDSYHHGNKHKKFRSFSRSVTIPQKTDLSSLEAVLTSSNDLVVSAKVTRAKHTPQHRDQDIRVVERSKTKQPDKNVSFLDDATIEIVNE